MTEEQSKDLQLVACAFCGQLVSEGKTSVVGGKRLCKECFENNTDECADCGRRVLRRDTVPDLEFPLCYDCYYDNYTTCRHCGALIRNASAYYDDNDEAYCGECYAVYANVRVIRNYGYKPEPIFYGSGSRFFGVELEIDGAGTDEENAADILEEGNGSAEHIYIKTDGSLNEGLEIVTHPMTAEYHRSTMPWEAITRKAVSLGYLSHKTSTCGLHVHVNRTSLGEDEEEQELTISRILFFVEKFWNELLRFSRRTQNQVERWAARYGYRDKPQDIMEHAKTGCGGRYTCVNILPEDTVEFRIFRGTLKSNTIIATVQLVDKICTAAYFMSDDEIEALSWPEFAASVKEPELIEYLKERRLYVNDEVESREDD